MDISDPNFLNCVTINNKRLLKKNKYINILIILIMDLKS